MKRRSLLVALTAAVVAAGLPTVARAEIDEVRLAKQFGLGSLPLNVVEELKLIEKHAAAAGLGEIKVAWSQFASGAQMNDALISGNLDFAMGGVGPLATIWARTRDNIGVHGVAALQSMPMYLNTNRADVRTIADFGENDRIALPAVKVSVQAITLQMAAAKAFGEANFAKLDPLTVSMAHPDGMAALLSGRSEITGHLTAPPFNFLELKNPQVHRVLSSYDVIGGPASLNLLYATKKFRDQNPKVYGVVLAALQEAVGWIDHDKQAAAELYVKVNRSREPVAEVVEILSHPDVIHTTAPQGILTYAQFMYKVGSIKVRPERWQDLFFPEIHGAKGS